MNEAKWTWGTLQHDKKRWNCIFAYVPKTRAKTTIILSVISPYGVIKTKAKRLRASVPSKRRNIISSAQTARNVKGGTVTEYYNFIVNALDILYQHG